MDTDFAERRRHIRVYFESLEETSCQITPAEQATAPLVASVLDLSLGGLHLACVGDYGFAVGDQLILNSLTHRTGPVCDEQIPMQIRWIFAKTESRGLYIGCQFLHLPEKSRSRIANLISVKLLESSAARIGCFNI